MPANRQPNAYNVAIRSIWDAYQRPLACELVRELGSRHPSARITQYWIKQALEVEPEAARRILGEEFLNDVYRPEVARQCGSFG